MEATERGIVYIDEVDKLIKKVIEQISFELLPCLANVSALAIIGYIPTSRLNAMRTGGMSLERVSSMLC